ncbi:MAG: RsmB/NOP family class I SAM-dependent RNA methyltransferase [Planctomycetota bacterium]|nr:RsmB/NOP family class I SAM-dependent RNA methyltransferase [Planctomycetota bacterium]MDA1178750.1 RsmB/NOP family class I SAM-dependent RNA methyltransferase [Planctomycetota bacterium]
MNIPDPRTSPFPQEFVTRLESILPVESWHACWTAFRGCGQFGARVNTLLANVDDVWERLACLDVPATAVEWLPEAFVVSSQYREQIVGSDLVTMGHVYVQNLSSMLAVRVLGAEPDEQVLDLAAAPGGKTTQLAAMMRNTGWLSAVEPIRTRFYKLQSMLRQYGVTIGHTYLTDGRTVGNKTPDRFDRVLLDAPCSGEARFRWDEPKTYQYWSLRKIREQSRKQKGLLRSALKATRPGGRILYSTCSFAPEENECVVHHLLARNSAQVRVVPVDLPINNWQPGITRWLDKELHPDVVHARRILPTDSMDAFFLCLLEKL